MKWKGRRQSENVEVRKPLHFVFVPGMKSVDDDLAWLGPRLGAKQRLKQKALDSQHLFDSALLGEPSQAPTARDDAVQAWYNVPDHRLTNLRTLRDTATRRMLAPLFGSMSPFSGSNSHEGK